MRVARVGSAGVGPATTAGRVHRAATAAGGVDLGTTTIIVVAAAGDDRCGGDEKRRSKAKTEKNNTTHGGHHNMGSVRGATRARLGVR